MPFVKRQRKYYKDGVEVPSSSITDFGSTKYYKNVVTTKYWKEITTGSKELEYYCYYKTHSNIYSGYMYVDANLNKVMGKEGKQWTFVKVASSSELNKDMTAVCRNITSESIEVNVGALSAIWEKYPRYAAGDLYKDTTVTETVEGTPEDYTYTTEEITPVEVSADDDYDFTEFVPSTQFDSYEDKNKLYSLVKKQGDKLLSYEPYFAKYERISQVFSVGNLQTYIVPENVTKLNVVCRASRGANSEDGTILGGGGGSVVCDLSVTPGQTLYITVGGIPSSAGTPSYNASDIRINGTNYANRIIVAGGGGSAAWRRGTGTGGKGGGLTGGAGKDQDYAHAGKGGTQSAGGAGGSVDLVTSQWSSAGGAGSLGMGGTSDNHVNHYAIGGCGGAGYYGGGGGGGMHTEHYNKAAGGGGGSSYTDDTLCDNVVHLQGVNNGEGYVKINYIKELK